MAGWETVVDHQLELWRFWRSDRGIRAFEAFVGDMRSKGRFGKDDEGEWVWRALTSSLFNADPFHVSDDMMEVLEAAAATFQPEALFPTDVITSTGFVVLPRAMYLRDVHGKTIAFRAFSWMPCSKGDAVGWNEAATEKEQNGIFVTLYSHVDDTDDYMQTGDPELDRALLRATWVTDFSLLHFFPWWFDDAEHLDEARELGVEGEAFLGTVTDMQVFFRLTMQYVAERSVMQPPRPARRRAERASFPSKNVVVVRLRRPRGQRLTESEHDVEWSCRWIVSGHWRKQWYPSLNAHRQVWISGYVKGPDDKELRLRKTRAFELVR